MPVPVASLVDPLVDIPHVSATALTVGVRSVARPAVSLVGYRVYAVGDTPPLFSSKEVVTTDPEVITYFTWDGLSPGTYTVDAYARNADGDSAVVTENVLWDPLNLYPDFTTYTTGPRPWEWEDFATRWMELVPAYYRDDPFVTQLFKTICEEFQRLSAAVEQVKRFEMPSRTYAEGQERWENLLGIKPPDTVPSERRRAMVLAHLRGRLDASSTLLEESLTQILGKAPNIREDFNNFTLTIDTEGDPEIQAIVSEVVQRIVPAHLLVNYASTDVLFDYDERHAPIPWYPVRGRATQRPAGFDPGGFDNGGMS